ncbi:MAG TPA: phospholipid carrier-dependent glycosyltransferase [Nanoarchaeota archaeon]|nr:phospholipid carrier-dependent glycosyltransferase [Nanoarchaeota archaeon]
MFMKKIIAIKNLRIEIATIFLTLLIFSGYLFVTFTSPIAFGDEGYYSSMGKWIAENLIYPKFHPLWGTPVIMYPTTRLPIGHITSSGFYLLFGEAGIKLLPPLFAFLSALLIFILFKNLDKKFLGALTALILLLLPATVKYGVLNYPEIQMLFFITASTCFFFLGNIRNNTKFLILSGIMLGFAFLSDITSFFFGAVFLLLAIYQRKLWKNIAIVILFSLLIFSPWVARNLALYNSPCVQPFFSEQCKVIKLVEPEKYEANITLKRPEISTGAGIYKFGLVQYVRFGFGVTGLLALIGLVFLLERKKDWKYAFFLLWLIVLVFANLYISKDNPRTEDMLRYSLFALPAVAFAISIVLEEIRKNFDIKYLYIIIPGISFSFFVFIGQHLLAYIIAIATAFVVLISKASENHVYQGIALAIFVLLSYSTAFYGVLEIVNMQRVKQFSPGFIEACEWVRENLPENASYAAIYVHPAEYNCYRRFIPIQGLPDGVIIRLWANETSYELLKKWKIDYIIVEGFTIVPDSMLHPESYPISFVAFLEKSDYFEKIFDNTQEYGPRGGVRIFKVK